MEDLYKEVDFFAYCETCKCKKLADSEEPCDECLNHPVNIYSHKPINWKEKTKDDRK